MSYPIRQALVTISLGDDVTPSSELSKSINSYIQLRKSYDRLDEKKKEEFVLSGDYHAFLNMLGLKLERIKKIAVSENIQLKIIEDNVKLYVDRGVIIKQTIT